MNVLISKYQISLLVLYPLFLVLFLLLWVLFLVPLRHFCMMWCQDGAQSPTKVLSSWGTNAMYNIFFHRCCIIYVLTISSRHYRPTVATSHCCPTLLIVLCLQILPSLVPNLAIIFCTNNSIDLNPHLRSLRTTKTTKHKIKSSHAHTCRVYLT